MRPTREYLINEYCNKKRSMKSISIDSNVSSQTIMRLIHKFGIKINKYDKAWNSGKTHIDDSRILANERHPRTKNTTYYNSDFRRARKEILPCICNRCNSDATLIHHRDKNIMNNNIENLEPLCSSCHSIHHNRLRGTTIYKHNCEYCGKEFVVKNNKKCHQKFCSRSCSSKYSYKNKDNPIRKINSKGIIMHNKTCKYCNNNFLTHRGKQLFCSHSCSSKYMHSKDIKP